MKEISKDQWREFVSKNCEDSYSLVVCLGILELWEHRVKTREQAHDVLSRQELGLSGAQAEMTIGYALSRETPDWLDKDMVAVSTN